MNGSVKILPNIQNWLENILADCIPQDDTMLYSASLVSVVLFLAYITNMAVKVC